MDLQGLSENMFITEKQLSGILGLSTNWLRNRRAKRDGPPFVKIGSSVRYKVVDIIRYIEENTFHPRPASEETPG